MTAAPTTNADSKLMKGLRIQDEKLTKEMYDAVLNPTDIPSIKPKKILQKKRKVSEFIAEFVAIEPIDKIVLGIRISIERTRDVISSLIVVFLRCLSYFHFITNLRYWLMKNVGIIQQKQIEFPAS